MKKLFTVLICAMMVLGVGGCEDSPKTNVPDKSVDDTFIIDIKTGLEKRWEVQTANSDPTSNIEDENDFYSLNEYIKIELDSIKEYKSKDFANKDLEKIANTYINAVQDMYNCTTKNGDLTSEITLKYLSASEERVESIVKLHTDYGLNIDKKYEDIFNDMLESVNSNTPNDDTQYYSDGTYLVGKDIAAGEYLALIDNLKKNSHIEVRTNEFKSSDEDVIERVSYFYNNYVMLQENQFLEIENCVLIPIENAPTLTQNDANRVELKVGRDIEQGNYIVSSNSDNNYFSITIREENGTKKALILNELNFSGEKRIQIKDGQYLELDECEIKKAD